MSVIFNGKKFAEEKLKLLKPKAGKLVKKGVIPKLVSFTIGENPPNLLYLNLKKKAAEKVGIKVEIVQLRDDVKTEELKNLIQDKNSDNTVHGIIVQLPLPADFTEENRNEIITTIDPEKDVDGLNNNSIYLTPVVKAVIEIVRQASNYLPKNREAKVVVVGAKGFEGRKIYQIFKEMGYDVEGVDLGGKNLIPKTQSADIMISVTGSEGLITKDMVKEGVIIIDVGSPRGDIQKEAYPKASFVSPVPGGVGPVTIACLMENLIISSEGKYVF
jgi:methylenetetrahydrofolate dehydrogenase (NADP+)/methenyltetrahydrofolate cyclohydrolase